LLVILLQAVGGLVVAGVLKYADNILKCFAVAISMILGAVCSRLVYKEGPELTDPLFVSGTALVLLATVLYSLGMEGICAKCWQNASPPADSTVDELEDDQDIELGKTQIAHSKASSAGSRVLKWLTFGTKTQTEHDFIGMSKKCSDIPEVPHKHLASLRLPYESAVSRLYLDHFVYSSKPTAAVDKAPAPSSTVVP
jgi:hypothetical protein